jgi:hypothetical protein
MKYFKDPITNEIYAYEPEGSQDVWIKPGLVSISNAEVDSIQQAMLQTKLNAMTYADKRAAEYPSFADQFDLLYHGGYDAWKNVIQTVKTKYPKPE